MCQQKGTWMKAVRSCGLWRVKGIVLSAQPGREE